VKITPTEEDFRTAAKLMHYDFDKLKERARKVAAERLLDENVERTNALIAQNAAMVPTPTADSRSAWLANADEITRLFDEHDKLCEAAFPASYTTQK
jgi:hypothetical protein